MTQDKRIRPTGENGTESEETTWINGSILAESPELRAAQAVDQSLVLVVVTTLPEGRGRRRVYYSLDSAVRATERASERGHEATVLLARLNVAEVIA